MCVWGGGGGGGGRVEVWGAFQYPGVAQPLKRKNTLKKMPKKGTYLKRYSTIKKFNQGSSFLFFFSLTRVVKDQGAVSRVVFEERFANPVPRSAIGVSFRGVAISGNLKREAPLYIFFNM